MSVQTIASATSDGSSAHERNEEPLRPLTIKDWLFAVVWGAVLGSIMAVVAQNSAPESMTLPLAVTGFGLGLLAYLDHVTHLILNTHNLIFAAAVGAALILPYQAGYSTWGPAATGAVLVFLFLLVLALVTGFAGGGDIKLAPIPAAALAVASPLAACMWLLVTFLVCLIYQIACKINRSDQKYAAMAPFMAVALVPALVISNVIMTAMGLE